MAVRIDVELNEDIDLPEIQEDDYGLYIPFGDTKVRFAPGVGAQNFSSHDVLTVFVSTATGIGINLLSSYIYDLLKTRKAKGVWVDREPVESEDQIKALLEEKVQK